jgi:hypothetical protein
LPDDDTVHIRGGAGGSPPHATAPLYLPGDPPPGRGRRVLIAALILLLGLAGGFAIAQFVSVGVDEELPDPDLVFYEDASMSFPIEGARFTDSTFDTQDGRCDPQLLKQYLRTDERRFAAWLDVQEIGASGFDGFVDRLETKILERATPVTNFGCLREREESCPFSIQSVLGPGTAVWIDRGDRIVAKCACSNPIREPRCPPNCETIPTPSPTPPPTPTPTRAPTPTPTGPPTPSPTSSPTPVPSPTPPTVSPTPTLPPPT